MGPAPDPAIAAVLKQAGNGDLPALRMLVERAESLLGTDHHGASLSAALQGEAFARLAAAIGGNEDMVRLSRILVSASFASMALDLRDQAIGQLTEGIQIAKAMADAGEVEALDMLNAARGMFSDAAVDEAIATMPQGDITVYAEPTATVH